MLAAPLEFTVTFQLPPASVEFWTLKVAVMTVDEEAEIFDTVMLGPACIVAPAAKPVPSMVTAVAAPTNPLAGEMLVIVGVTGSLCANIAETLSYL